MCKHRDSPSCANFCRVLLSFAACTLVRPIVSTRSMSRACRMRATRSPKPALKPPQKKAELPQTAEPLMHLTAPAPTGLHCRLDGCGRPSGRGNDSGAGSFLSGSSAQVASLIASEWPGSFVLLHTTQQILTHNTHRKLPKGVELRALNSKGETIVGKASARRRRR